MASKDVGIVKEVFNYKPVIPSLSVIHIRALYYTFPIPVRDARHPP